MTDDELMIRGAAGDDEAFRILVERWQDPIISFLVRMLGSREEAKDLSQEAFLKLVRSAGRYEPKGRFKSWLFRIAGNLARSRLRRRRIIRWLSLDRFPVDLPAAGSSIEQELEARETREDVRRAIAALPPRQREALVLKQYHDMKYAEIAEVMGITTGSVQMLLHRAMLALSKEFSRKGESHDS